MESLPHPLVFEEFNQHVCASSPMEESKYFTQELAEDLMHLVFEDVDQGHYNAGDTFTDDFYQLSNSILESVGGFADELDVYQQQDLNSSDEYLDLLANADEFIGEELNIVNTSLDNLNMSLLFDENQPHVFSSDVNSVFVDSEQKSQDKIPSPGIEAADEFGLLDKFEKEIQIPVNSPDEFIDVCKINDDTLKCEQNSQGMNETSLDNVDVKVECISEPASVKSEDPYADSKVNATKSSSIKKVKSENDMKCKSALNRKKQNIKCEEINDIAEIELKKALAKLTSEEKIRQMKERARALSQAIQQQLVDKTKTQANPSSITDHMQDHSYANNSEYARKKDGKDIDIKVSKDNNSNGHNLQSFKDSKSSEILTNGKTNTNTFSSNNMSNGSENPSKHVICDKTEKIPNTLSKPDIIKQEFISPKKNITKSNRPTQQTAQVIVCSSANKPQRRMTSILKVSKLYPTPQKIHSNEVATTCCIKLNEQISTKLDSCNTNCVEKKPVVRALELNPSKPHISHQAAKQSNSELCPAPDMIHEVVINNDGVTLALVSSMKVKKKLSLSEYKLLLPKRRSGDIKKPKSPFDTDQIIEYDYCYTSDHSYHKGFDMTAKQVNEESKSVDKKILHQEEKQELNARNNCKKFNIGNQEIPCVMVKINKNDLKEVAVSVEHCISDDDSDDVQIQMNKNEPTRETTLVSQFVADLQRRRKLKDERRINVYNSKKKRSFQSSEDETNEKVVAEKNLENTECTSSDSISDCELISSSNDQQCKRMKNRHESRSRSRSRSRSFHRSNSSRSSRTKFRSRYLPTKRPSYESRSRSRSRSRSSSFYSSSSRSRSRSRSYSRSSARSGSARGGSRFNQKSKPRNNSRSQHDRRTAMEERRVVYINHLPSHYTKAHLERKMSYFGSIVESSVHFRDNRDCFGFVTYETSLNAARAIQDGHKVPGCETFEFCYGGRREFCGSNYSDLDHEAVRYSYRRPAVKQNTASDYQNLLMETLEHIRKRCQWSDDS